METQKAIEEVCADLRTQIQALRKKALIYACLAALGAGFFSVFFFSVGKQIFLNILLDVVFTLVVFAYVWRSYTRDFVKPLQETISEVENEPTTADEYAFRAITFLESGYDEAAELDYRKSFERNPECDWRTLYFAEFLHHIGKDEEALKTLEPLLSKEGNDQADAYSLQALIYKKDDPQAALNSLAQAIHVYPDDEDYYLDRADILIDLDRFDEAEEDLQKTEEIRVSFGTPSERLHALRSKLWTKKGEPEKALKEINIAQKIAGRNSDPTLYEQRAAIHDKLGNYAQAELDRQKAARLE